MNSNRIHPAQMVEMPVRELSRLPVEHLALLLEDVTALKSAAKRADDHLSAAIHERYADTALQRRKEKDIDAGTVRFDDGEFTIISDLPKKVAWDTEGLAQVERQLTEMGEPAREYIVTARTVRERSYEAWPASLKKLFAPHRTLGTGKPTYKIEAKGAV